MPHLKCWRELPAAVREHLIERMRDRKISLPDLDKLRMWVATSPIVPWGEWYKDFGSFKLCGEGPIPKTFLTASQPARGEML